MCGCRDNSEYDHTLRDDRICHDRAEDSVVLTQIDGNLCRLAHTTFDADGESYDEVEILLDEAWEYLNSPRQPRDGNYAFILSKCAPSLEYFGRDMQARAARTVAEEIYEDTIGAEVL